MTMYDHLQSRYPGSSWLSEFLGCEHGLFLVRAVLSLDGERLATALAGADTIEAAEDQARDRLAALLSLSTVRPSAKSLPHRRAEQEAVTVPEAEELRPPLDALSAAAPALESSPPTAIADVDEFVRVNAETQRHLKRLGWDGDRVRTYLLQTYRRPSRQQLHDDELLEFLAYLKTQ
ncbi:MAG: hypothetical protein HC910_02945 [Spirulinaceae cyanobacterium SM2_1_0]|nr:hypothetical protein [Spirulinaceae cyanobacterium SM2_1_0]